MNLANKDRLYILRTIIVARLEEINNRCEVPEYWRVLGGVVQRGIEYRCGPVISIRWTDVPSLSAYLCAVRRSERNRLQDGIPF